MYLEVVSCLVGVCRRYLHLVRVGLGVGKDQRIRRAMLCRHMRYDTAGSAAAERNDNAQINV